MKRIIALLGLVGVLIIISSIVVGAGSPTYKYYFPITITDTSGTDRSYIPVDTGISGATLIDSGYMSSTGMDTNMQLESTTEPCTVDNQTILTVVNSLKANSAVTYNLFTGYTIDGTNPRAAMPIVVGNNGYITKTDSSSYYTPSDSFTLTIDGFFDTTDDGTKYIYNKANSLSVYNADLCGSCSPTTPENRITAQLYGATSSYYSSASDGYVYKAAYPEAEAWAATSGTADSSATTFKIGQKEAFSVGQTFTQTSSSSSDTLGGSYWTRLGEKLSGFKGTVDSVTAGWTNFGSPTGTIYCRVYAWGGTLIGTLGSHDVSSPGSYTFNSAVTVSTEQDIFVCFEYTGGDGSNYVQISYYHQSPNTKYIGVMGYYSSGSGWTTDADNDWTFTSMSTTSNQYEIDRGALYFDVSSIPNVTQAIFTGAVLKLYGSGDASTTDFDINVYNGKIQPIVGPDNAYEYVNPSDPLVGSDYNKSLYTSLMGSVNTSGFTTSGYNSITLSSFPSSLPGGIRMFIRSSRDVAATTPTGDEYVTVYSSNETGTSKDPQLVLTYTLPVTATGITPGEHTVVVGLSSGTFSLTVDGTLKDSQTYSGTPVSNNSSLVMADDNSMPYVDSIAFSNASYNFTIAPTAKLLYGHDYVNDYAVTYGANSNISLKYGAVQSYATTNPAPGTNDIGKTAPTIYSTSFLSTWFNSGSNITSLPLYGMYKSTADGSTIPVGTLYVFTNLFFAIFFAVVVIMATRTIFLGIVAADMIILLGVFQTVYPGWIMLICLFVPIGLVFVWRQQ